MDEGKELYFEPIANTFTASEDNQSAVIIFIDGAQLDLEPGDTGLLIGIDIKPGNSSNSINLGSKGTIPVAIFCTVDFDATTVDPTTVTLADPEVKVRGQGTSMASEEDVNGDGLRDLVVHVQTEGLDLIGADSQSELTGKTFDGSRLWVPIQSAWWPN